jgi:parallel beta-helix repeat protein
MFEVSSSASSGTIIGPGNSISGANGHCLTINNSDTLVVDNVIADCGADGVLVSGNSVGTRLIGNLIVGANVGIAMAPGAAGTVMWHNTIASSWLFGIDIGQSSGNDLRNNVLAFNGTDAVSGTDSKFSQQDYNLFFGNGGDACNGCTLGVSSLLLDPSFVDASADDYALRTGSPAIDAGTPLGVDRNQAGAGDFDGSAPDIGYLEQR